MKTKFDYLIFTTIILSVMVTNAQEIPIEYLDMELQTNTQDYSKTILENEIAGIHVDHITLVGDAAREQQLDEAHKFIYLFIKGQGNVVADDENFEIVPETILLPNSIQSISINAAKNDTLQFLKISSELTAQDRIELKEFPKENIQKPYFKKFIDCEPYTEPIKSPNTVSRTILPNKYIPRIAMGTVETMGPDKVDPHEHGMLEQLFLGLTDNDVVVYADDAQVDFPAYSILHIPLGSSHSVTAGKEKKMYYVWMDFFRDSKGEEWLKTHNAVKKQ